MIRHLAPVLLASSLMACSSSDPEQDPVYAGSPTSEITSQEISRWNQAYGWGDHAQAGYLTAESDPSFAASTAASISTADVASWNQAAAWGDHAQAGYLTAESDPLFYASTAASIAPSDVTSWNQAVAWGDHAQAGYLKTESDPKIGTLTSSAVPHWENGQLRAGALSDTGARVGVATDSPSGALDVRAPSSDMTADQLQEQAAFSTRITSVFQVFIAGKAGLLSAVDLYWVGGANTFQVDVLESAPGTLLASTDCQAFTTGWVTCRFSSPATVSVGTKYKLVLTVASATLFGCADGDVYPGGTSIPGGYDLSFRTWVGSAQPVAALEVGSGAVNVKTLFHLAPRTSAPASAEAGDVYYDGPQHKLCYFNGTGWTCL